MNHRALPRLIAACALASVMAVAAVAQAASADTSATAAKTAKKHKSGSAHRIRSPSYETTAERERRLARECKGMPNAGACLGYGD